MATIQLFERPNSIRMTFILIESLCEAYENRKNQFQIAIDSA